MWLDVISRKTCFSGCSWVIWRQRCCYVFLYQQLSLCLRLKNPWSCQEGMWTSSPRPLPVRYSCAPARACLRQTSKPPWHTLASRWETQGRLRGGASRHAHQSQYFSAPTLTSIKISQRDRTLLLISPHTIPCSAVQTVGSDMGAGSDGVMQLSVIVPTVVMVEILLPWKLSFTSHFLTRHTTLTANFAQLWWKLLISTDRY